MSIFPNKVLFAYLVIVLIVIFLIFIIARCSICWFSDLNVCGWANNLIVYFLLLIITLFIMGYATYQAYCCAQCPQEKNFINIAFFAQMILILIWVALFFRRRELGSSFCLALVIILVTLFQIWACYRVDYVSGWGILPYLTLFIIIAVANYEIRKNNPDPYPCPCN